MKLLHRKAESTSTDYGAFTRVLPLPAGAIEANVKATYVDGVLEVQVPVDAETAAARRVPVTST